MSVFSIGFFADDGNEIIRRLPDLAKVGGPVTFDMIKGILFFDTEVSLAAKRSFFVVMRVCFV